MVYLGRASPLDREVVGAAGQAAQVRIRRQSFRRSLSAIPTAMASITSRLSPTLTFTLANPRTRRSSSSRFSFRRLLTRSDVVRLLYVNVQAIPPLECQRIP